MFFFVFYFFFFQAEDGIRDIGVTGVQTCALPISDRGGKLFDAGLRETAPWLARAGTDRRGRELLELQSSHAIAGGYERGEPSPQSPPSHGATPPRRRLRTPLPRCSWGRRARPADRSWALRLTERSSV